MVNLAVRFPIPWCPKWPTKLCLILRKASQLLFQNFLPRLRMLQKWSKIGEKKFHKIYNLCHLGTFPRVLLTSHSCPTVEKKHPKIILRNYLHGISVSKGRHASDNPVRESDRDTRSEVAIAWGMTPEHLRYSRKTHDDHVLHVLSRERGVRLGRIITG